MTPTCPPDYSCTFTLLHARIVNRNLGPWWQHTGGLVVAMAAIAAIGVVLICAVVRIMDLRAARQASDANERQRATMRAHELALEEQRTMQADAAKGDPEMLRLIRQRI